MCLLVLLYDEYSCGHQVLNKRHKVDCNAKSCTLSRTHLMEIHDCVKTCIRPTLPEHTLPPNSVPNPCYTCRYGLQ
ncbi:hypothetical protein L208DRAFT_1392254 [Tricholoma matsutake]|nr:hypothetical protein L208DRAFT_1392254 [Tricholoma matsutake 945]